MKRIAATLIPVVLIAATASSQQTNTNNVQNTQSQTSTAVGGGNADSVSTAVVGDNTATAQGGNGISYSSATATGGEGIGWSTSTAEGGTGVAWSDGDSAAVVDIDTTSISKYANRTAPMTTYPPYLPIWNHGGWGTINAFFPNGPAGSDGAYQRTFDPSNRDDTRELRKMLGSIPPDGILGMLEGMMYGVVALFGGPDYTHRARGFEVANSLVQDPRPRGKPLVVFIDSYVDPQLLKEAGYAYVGRVSVEGKYDRNWDQAYSVAVADTLPWDVDVLLVSGGMKGVTVGTNTSFPTASYGYSQSIWSASLFGGIATGITEGKGEAVVSASGYRYSPSLLQRRKVPESLFERIRRAPSATSTAAQTPNQIAGTASAVTAASRPAAPDAPARKSPGVDVSKQLYDMAGFTGPVDSVTVK